jgi:hypothetical protein
MEAFEDEALKMAEAGRKIRINDIREIVRSQRGTMTVGDEFKFPNAYSPAIARLLICKHPHLGRFIRCNAGRWAEHMPYVAARVQFLRGNGAAREDGLDS